MSRDRPSCAASPSPPDLTLFPEDELVSLDELQEKVAEFEDYVQSTDVAAMQSKRLALRVHGRSLIRFASRRAVRSVYYVRRRVVCIRIGGFEQSESTLLYYQIHVHVRASVCTPHLDARMIRRPRACVRACRAAMSPHCAWGCLARDLHTQSDLARVWAARGKTCRVPYSDAGTITVQAAG